MLSDSEYYPSNNSEQDDICSDTVSTITNIEYSLVEILTETDITDIAEDIMSLIHDMISINILSLSSPFFYNIIIADIIEILLDEWIDSGIIYNDDDLDNIAGDLQELVEQIMDFYKTTIGPRRSIRRVTSMYEKYNKNTIIFDGLKRKVELLQDLPQPKQKTIEWYEFRYSLISASNLWKVFGSDAQRNSLVAEKCVHFESFQNKTQFMNTESAMHWGNKYEPVTVMIYEIMYETKVGEFGCIRHPRYPFIGASPDGINIDMTNPSLYGRMLEIKNIVNRDITGIPKKDYWIQTQIQMETCDLNECDFMETRFLEYTNEELFYEDQEHEYKGIILHFIEINLTKDSMPIYMYMPANLLMERDKKEVERWIVQEREIAKKKGLVLFTRIYWYLEEYSCVLIERNREWFGAAISEIEDLWNKVIQQRESEKSILVIKKE